MPENIQPIKLDLTQVKPSIQDKSVQGIGTQGLYDYETLGKYDENMPTGVNQEQYRSYKQGTTAEIANGLGRATLNLIPSIIGNVASIADLEDYNNSDKEIGNAVTKWAEDFKQGTKEALPIYGENQLESLDMGQSEWWTSNFSSLAESAASFALTGAGLGAGVKGLGFLGKIAGASSTVQKAIQAGGGVATAVALNQAEAIPSAMSVYEKTLDYQMNTLGKSEDEAKQIAADAAAYTININRLNLPLNITSTLAFLRTSPMTRQAIQQAGLKSAGAKIAEEGAQEFGEEIINKVAEDEGNRYGKIGKEYNYNINNTVSDVFSAEGLEAGLLGMLGGIAQTGATEGIEHATGKYTEQNKLYQKQQASLKQLEQFSGSPNLKDVVGNITTQASIINDLNDAQAEGDETKVESLKNQLLINQAVNSFDAGTTDQLEEMYSTISKTPVEEGEAKYGKEFKENAIKATSQIRQWENDWNKFMQTVPDTFNKKELFINKLQQKDISNRINDLKQSESKLASEIETIKLNSQENVSIPQEVELKAIQDNIGKLQGQLNYVQQKSVELVTPIQEQPKVKTPEQKTKAFKETPVDTSEDTKEPVETLETVTPDVVAEVIPSEETVVAESTYSLDNTDLVEAVKIAHDLFLPKKQDQVEKYIRGEEWKNVGEQLKATQRFSKLLEKKGINPKEFNINTVEQIFKDSGQQDYFEVNKEAISAMISSIGIATGTLTPLSFDKNIPPDVNETLEEVVSEPSGLKRTTSLNGRYKEVKTNGNGGSLKAINGVENKDGDIQFENNDNTHYYDLLHTNDILLGDELELELENPGVEGDLDSLHIRIIDKKSGKLRFYVSSIESVNEDSLDLDEEQLEIERQKIRDIREYFNNNRYGKLQTKLDSTGTGKLEWNGTAKSIAKIPNVHKYLHVKINGDLVGQNSPKWVGNFPNPDWFNEMSEGTILLTLPEADHNGGYLSRPTSVNVGTFNTSRNPSTELTKIREEVKQELVKYIQTGKVDFKVLNKWIYVQDNNIDPAQLGKKGIQLKNKSIVFSNNTYNTEEAIDSILDQLRVNVSAKLLKDSNSDYATRLINSGVLQSKIAYKQVGEDTIFAFQPTFVYSQPTEVAQETKEETPEEIKKETGIDGDFSLGNTSFDLGFSPRILPLKGNESVYKEYNLLNDKGDIKQVPYNIAQRWVTSLNQSPKYSFRAVKALSNGKIVYKIVVLDKSNTAFDIAVEPSTSFNINPNFTLNQEDKIINSFAYEILQGNSKDQLVKYFNKFLTHLESDKSEAAESRKELINNTLKHLDSYLERAKQLLDSLDFAKDELGFYNEFIDADNSLDQMQDEAAFTEIRVDSIPENVRKFLMYIPQFNNDGTLKRNALGLKTFTPVDTTFNKIAIYLSTVPYDNTKSSFNKMVEMLSNHSDPTLKEVAKQLKEVNNEQLQNQFYRAFNQQIIDSRTFLISSKDKGFGVRVARADKSSAFYKIKQEWNINFNSAFINNGVVNTEKGKLLNDRFKELASSTNYLEGKLTNQAKDTLLNLLSELGIVMSSQGLNSWLQNDSNYKDSKLRRDKEHLKYTLAYVFANVAGESKKTVVSEDEDVVTKNNPFENEAKHIESLAYQESSFSKVQGGSSFRHDGKQYSSFVRHMPLETQLNNMKQLFNQSVGAIKNGLTNKPVFQHSFYAQQLDKVKFIVERGLRITKKGSKSKNLKDANEKEHEAIRILAFQKDGYIKTDTLSDKTTNVFFNVPKVDVQLTTTGQLTESVKKHLHRYFDMEYDRIKIVQQRIGNENKYDGFDSTVDEKGAGEYFLNYDFLNYEVLGDSKDEQFLKKYLYNDLGRLEDLSKYDLELNTTINLAIDNLIEKRVNQITEKIKQDWLDLGVYTKTDKGVVINDIDVSYKAKLAKTLTDSNIKPTDTNILLLAIKDYQVNYMTQTIEMLWLYGDPALQSKIKYPKNSNTLSKDELISGIKKTFENVGKRNASLMAQSEGGNWSSKTYKVAFINDIGINSNDVEQYAKDVQQDYQDGEKMTDAQEFTTVEEHLEDRLAFGEISKNLFYLGVMHFDPDVYNSKDFINKYPDRPKFKVLSESEVSQLNGILQPRKPVQVFNKFTPEGLQVKYYIKTSSIPLIPSVVRGRPLEDVLKLMKTKGVQRLAFNSGVKIGQGGAQTLFIDNEVNPDLFKEGVHTLERSGYGIQLNVPYKEGKDEIRQVTQAMKLLFVDLNDSMTLSNGMSVKEARDKYREIEKQLVDNSTNNLNKDFGAQNGVIVDTSKLSDLLIEEGNDRGYTQNTLAGLKTKDGKFKIPLTYSPNIGQIQPVLTSLINNRIVRQKISGKSYVQTSEILTYKPKGFEELSSDAKSSIVWLTPEYKTKSKLDFIKRGDKESSPAEIIAPWFLVKDGKKVPILEYVTEDGYIDFIKIDESLLEMHGFRIPNQAHSSMMHFKTVGFLPEGMGDTLIVPSEIAIQMGSDYDVDKLYAYNYEWKDVDGKLIKKDSLVNQLIDIHKAVILSKQMFDVVTKPQGFSDLKDAIQEVSKSLPQDNEWLGSYNPIYQRKEFFDNAAGKTGVGIASNHNTQHALSQQANLFIKDRGIVFKKDDGSYFSEEVNTNRVNEFTKGQYVYRQDEDNIDMTERNDSAWRLDKVRTFSNGSTPGKIISNVIAEWQGASVDNAKEKLLGSGGINDYNLSVSLLIARAGFDNEWILNFINQPILKEYYKTIDNLKSVFYDSFESDRRNKAIADLYSKYGVNKDDLNKFLKEPFEGYTLGEYKDMLTTLDNEKQVNILKAFLHYEKLALGLATLQSATSIDVKGLPKNYVETVELSKKQGVLDKLPVGNTYNMWNTVVGGFLEIPQYTTDLYSEIFDYSTEAYSNVLTTLQYLQKSDGFTTEQLNKIYNNLYSFIYTLPSIQESVADGKNVEDYKKSLVLGNNNLSDRVQELKLKYPNNLLLSRISRVLDNQNQVKRIQLDSTFSKTESYDKEVTASWLDMIRNNQSDLELKQLGLDLAAYAMYFNNEPYGVSNFMKYVPIEYFETIGFGEKLQDIHYQLSDKDFLDNFTQQYYQHNVEDAKSATSTEQVSNEGGIITFDKDNAGSLILGKQPNSVEVDYSPFVKIYNKKTSNYDLYKLVDTRELLTYQKIDQLGETGFNEYDFSKENQTSLLHTNVSEVPNIPVKQVNLSKKPKFIYKDYFKLGTSHISNPKDLLRNVLEQTTLSNNNVFSILAEQLLGIDSGFTVELAPISNKLILAQTDANRKVMTFDVSKFKDRTPYEIQRTILHEFVHAFTLGKLNDPEFKQTKEYKKLESVWNKWKASLSKDELAEAEDFKKRYEDYISGNKQAFQGLSEPESKKSKYYPYVKLDEFVTHAMTDQEFQSKLDSISGTSEGLWRDFVNAIKDLIKSVVSNSLLDESIEATIGVINAKKKVSVAVSQDFGLTIGDLMKEMTSEQRARFRELRESGIFTTKC